MVVALGLLTQRMEHHHHNPNSPPKSNRGYLPPLLFHSPPSHMGTILHLSPNRILLESVQQCCLWLASVCLAACNPGIFKDAQFHPILDFGHFGVSLIFSMFLPHNEFWPFFGPPSHLTFFHIVKNHGGGAQKESQEELSETKNRRKRRKQHMEENQNKQKENNKERHSGRGRQCSPCFLVKTSPTAGR